MDRVPVYTALPEAAPLFAALGEPTRVRLLLQLSSRGPQSIARLSTRCAQSRQAVTKHLRVLERAGLVRGQRRGREHLWELDPRRLDDARAYIEVISRQWDAALERLRAFVEE